MNDIDRVTLLLRYAELSARMSRKEPLTQEEDDEKSRIPGKLGLTPEEALAEAKDSVLTSYDKKKS